MKPFTIAAIALLGTALSGCATIISGSSQGIAMSTPPVTGAQCTFSRKDNSWTINSPGTVNVDRSKHDIAVRCDKPGYEEASATIPSSFNNWFLLDILLTSPLAVGIDLGTGAYMKYPDTFEVTMHPAPAAAPTTSSGPGNTPTS